MLGVGMVPGQMALQVMFGARRLERDGAREADQGGLGGDVVDAVHRGEQAVDRGDIDDAAEVALAACPDSARRTVWKAADRLTASARSQSSGLNCLDRRKVADHRVVDQHIDAMPNVLRAVAARSAICAGVGHVGAVMDRAHAMRALELAAPALDLVLLAEAVHHDIAALGRQPLGHG